MFVKPHTDALFVISRILRNEFNVRAASESSNKRAIATFQLRPTITIFETEQYGKFIIPGL